ncbi:625_t:CDS:2 [Cetraspora pellucida]|uniref:625_t:CDS:1 n=1 Tax=Cetraspora pellucida TaxID=1433469 RepID=A0A9N9EY48_9GLOM|nr:625_t:CDS:2 [Cetraspora pellucida]
MSNLVGKHESYKEQKETFYNGTKVTLILLNNIKLNQIDVKKISIEKELDRNEIDNKYCIIATKCVLFKTFNHENVLHVFGLTNENGNFYIVREYANNGDLHDYIKNHPLIPWNEKIALIDKRPNCSKVIEELNKISCEQVYNENAKNYECGNKYKNQIVISLDFDSSKSTNQIVNHFKLTKGRNRNGHDFDITKNDMLKNGEIKTCKKECVPTVYFEKKNTNPWEMLNDISSSQYSNGDNLFPDADTIQIHIPIRIIEYRGNLNDYFIKEVKDALNILDIYEKKIKLKGILDDYGNYVITKFTIGGTIYCSKASSKSIEHLQTYLNWGINYAKNESLPVFELTSLEDFPSFETLPSRPMKCVNDLYSWLKDLYDCKNVAIISYEGYKPFYELLDDKLKNEIFECFSFKPININLSKLIPQLSTAYEQKNFSEWASKPSILSHVHDLTKNLSLQYFISPKHYSNLGYGKRITFKFLKQPKIILNHKIFISFIHPQNQHITHLSYNVDESSYNITPIEDFKCSTQIYCQITYQVAEIFLDPSSILPEELFSKEFNSYKSFGNYYNHTLPKTFTIGGTLTTHEACGTPNIPYKFPQEILPGNINQILADLKINNTSFISNNGKIINKYQIKDWLEGFLTNPINWKINSFDDLFASYKTLYQLREDIEFISDNEYQFVFNGENLLSRDNQNIVVIKFTRPLINDNYLIFGNILKKCSNNLDESWERIPDATIAFSNKEKQYQYIFEEEFEDFSNEDNKKLQIIKGGINPYSQEKIILNWCIINEKELKNKKLSLVRFILDDESRKDFDYLVDCDRNDLPSLDTTKKNALPTKHINFGTFNLGSFSCSDKNSKENEWKIQLAIKTENNESLANRDHSKNIKARNAHALKIPLVVPTLNSLVDEIKINIFKFILYPKNLSLTYVNKINERLSEFIELGFRLTYSLICDIFQLFEHRLDDIGEPLLESFSSLKKDEHFFENCIIETIKPQRNLKKIDLLEFLYRNMKQNKEGIFLNAMKFHGLDNHLIDNEKLKTSTPIKSLSLSPIYYYWSLSKFKSNSLIASLCFKDILQTRIISDDDILGPLFKGYLAEIYKLRVTFQFPLPLIEIENDEKNVKLIKEWSPVLEKMNHNINTESNEIQITEEFKAYFIEFAEKAF